MPLTSVNMAEVAPMPNASVIVATMVNAGMRRNVRSANRKSARTDSSHSMYRTSRTHAEVAQLLLAHGEVERELVVHVALHRPLPQRKAEDASPSGAEAHA